MTTRVGLWIDHREATIVAMSRSGDHVDRVISKVETQPRRLTLSRSDGATPPHVGPSEDRRQHALTGHFSTYYDRVIECISGAESILIFGPGEAKSELLTRLQRRQLSGLIESVETADKMTDRQISTKVRNHHANRSAGRAAGASCMAE